MLPVQAVERVVDSSAHLVGWRCWSPSHVTCVVLGRGCPLFTNIAAKTQKTVIFTH